jgi:hypothetical protein
MRLQERLAAERFALSRVRDRTPSPAYPFMFRPSGWHHVSVEVRPIATFL